MEYTLLDKVVITRPILFLCGPYYEKNNKSDRRVILQEKIYSEYKNKYLPLVIDDFLTEKNIQDDKIDIQLMEEICAAISYKTFIFLDTMSSATELGIFANSAYFNQIKVYIPKISDIYNKKNVGYFVRDVVLKKHAERVNCLEYRPGIERKAIATDYVVEHYKFVNDRLPLNLEKDIKNDPIFKSADEHNLELIDDDAMPETPYQICYQKREDCIHFNISIRLLFYITVSIISYNYKDMLSKKDNDFSKFDIIEITNQVKKCVFNYLIGKTKEDLSSYKIIRCCTVLKVDEEVLIYHIAKFVHMYYLYSQFHSSYLMPNPIGNVIDIIQVGIHPFSFFNISGGDIELIEDILKYKDKYFEHIVIKTNKKKRDIIKYKDDENGSKARELHKQLSKVLNEKYIANDSSFAYMKGKSIKQCVEKHKYSKGFLKYDIKKFFNSIKSEKLLECFLAKFNIDVRFREKLQNVLDTCFYGGKLPLGLVPSPILSDIYLSEFDNILVKNLNKNGLIYTRYADDIMISCKDFIDDKLQKDIDKLVRDEMEKLGLLTNDDKKLSINFNENKNFIRYIGVNIVKGVNENYISVGKTYIYDVAREYLIYKDKLNRLNNKEEILTKEEKEKLENDVFYERLVIIGKVGFIQHIEGKKGIERMRKRLFKHNVNFMEDKLIV